MRKYKLYTILSQHDFIKIEPLMNKVLPKDIFITCWLLFPPSFCSLNEKKAYKIKKNLPFVF